WGNVHATIVTTPVSLTALLRSYSVSNPWWATSGAVRNRPRAAARSPRFLLMCDPLLFQWLVADSGARSEAARDAILIVLEADELRQFDVGTHVRGRELQVDRPGERARILDGDVVDHRSVIRPRVAFDRVQLVGVRHAFLVVPVLAVVADSVDDECVALPPADRVSELRRQQL